MRRLALAALGALALALPAAAAAPPRPTAYCLKGADRAKAFWFQSADKVRLAGISFGTGTRGVVLAHQSQADLCQWLPEAKALAGRGYRTLVLELRRHGNSGYPRRNAQRYDLDIDAAVRELRRRGAKKIVTVGASLGASAILISAARTPVDGVVSLSSPDRFGLVNPLAAMPRLRVPALFAAAEEDGGSSGFDFAQSARDLHGTAASADKALVIVPGDAHGVDLLPDATVRAALDAFLELRTQ